MFKNNKIFKIDINGNRKRIFFVKGLKIKFRGENSVINLYEPLLKFKKSYIALGSNCTVSIQASDYIAKKLIIQGTANGVNCTIGKNFSCTNETSILLHREDNLSVSIGEDCMFGSHVLLRTSDAHSIVDMETGKVTNYGANIDIGNHCWLAMNVTVLKGVTIKDNCVIGAGSLVNKSCQESNALYAGIPAKLVKTGITWNRQIPQK